jgi:hypothetical protein
LVRRIFSRETQRPSLVQEWQIPQLAASPTPSRFLRELPLDAHETSYLALAARIPNFSCKAVSFVMFRLVTGTGRPTHPRIPDAGQCNRRM